MASGIGFYSQLPISAIGIVDIGNSAELPIPAIPIADIANYN